MNLVQSNPQIHGPNGIYESYRRMYAAIGVDNVDSLLQPPPPTDPIPTEAGVENNTLLLGGTAKAFPEQNHDAHIEIHKSLLKTSPVQSNLQVQANIFSHIMEHLQMKADALAQQQMPQEAMAQYQQLQQASQQTSGQDQQQLVQQAAQILGQFSAPILAQLVSEFTETVSSPADEDPLVTIRKQELALKGQELAQEQRQFAADQERKIQESQARVSVDKERIDASEGIARMKDDTAQDRLEQQRIFKSIDLQNK
jgi:hypothetical protein